jgi:predicted TIM-barrel fold metal-dependent hydrolase
VETEKWVSEKLRPLQSVTAPNFAVPAGAVDCHFHVFGPQQAYPASPDARYTLPEGSLAQYQALAARLHLERAVFVQPSYYATDNRCLLDAMTRFGRPCRGVALLPDKPTAALLAACHARGVRGARLDFFKAPPADHARLLDEAAAIASSLGWHVEFYAPGQAILALEDRLAKLEVNFSVNHLGYLKDGSDSDFARFLALARTPRCWVKLTAPYRVTPDAARSDAMARQLIAAIPSRLVWGSDWPHVMTKGMDAGALLNHLAVWCPDEKLRTDILVRNPERLYRFERA